MIQQRRMTMSFVCIFDIKDDLKYLRKSSLGLCNVWDIQYPYNCIGNSQGRCSCITVLQHPKSNEEAEKYCKTVKGNIVEGNKLSIEDFKYIFQRLLEKKEKESARHQNFI